MASPITAEMLLFIDKEIGHLPFQLIQDFIKRLSPSLLKSNLNLFQCLCRAVIAEYEIRLKYSATIPVDQITWHIIGQAQIVSKELRLHIQKMLENPFFTAEIKKVKEKYLPVQAQANKYNRGKSYKSQPSNDVTQPCFSLQAKPQCICLNQREIVTKDEFSFKCGHCDRLYHTVCFKRKHNSQSCSYCYLQKMIPTKKVVKTAYIGLMRKNAKKHTATITFPEVLEDQKLEVRCLRVKDGAQNACLFPDITEIRINDHLVQDFDPISKISCLKYRKDQPFNILKGDFFPGQENTFIIDERVSSQRRQREYRCESQNHIIAIYVVEEMSIQRLISEMKVQGVLGFSQSKSILSRNLKSDKGDDQISFQFFKIPVNCPLSASRIEIPARGFLCTHFKCFDLINYLKFISETQNPRWKCPICPHLAYQLQIDPIIHQILIQNKDNHNLQEIMFLKNGDYDLVEQDKPLEKWKNIKDLGIPEKKPKHLPCQVEEKTVNVEFAVPVNAEVIDLD